MRYEPPIDRARLVEVIREVYAIAVQEIVFIPLGFEGASYDVRSASGERYFLKLWPGLHIEEAAAARQYGALTLARALHDRRLLSRMAHPIPTRAGALWTDLSGIPLALYPFLPGQMPPYPLPFVLRQELGRTIAAIQGATPALADVLPPRESFAIPDESTVARCLAVVERIGSETRPGLRSLRRLVLPRRDEILVQHARLRHLQGVVRGLGGPFVLCHGDLTGNNLLVDAHGRLTVLDWDWPSVAPPEHDLWAAIGDNFGSVLNAYLQAGGVQSLHLDHFAFFLLRRFLGDMLARLERLLDADAGEHEDEELLRGMEAYGFARWSALDATLAEIAVALADRSPNRAPTDR